MTFRALVDTAKRFWKLMLACVVVCAALGLGYGLMKPGSYKANATVASSVDVAALKGQAEAAAQQQKGAKVSVSADTTSKTIRISGDGKSDRVVVESVNRVAGTTEYAARTMLATATVRTSGARQASYSRRSPLMFGAIGAIGGVFVALCALVLVTERRAPVSGARELEELTKIPVLGTIPTRDDGALLAANVRFSAGETLESVCIVPVGHVDAAETRDLLARALEKSLATAPRVVACKSIGRSVDTLYEAHDATVTLLAIAEWNDSLRDVDRTIRELEITKANVAGIVFVKA